METTKLSLEWKKIQIPSWYYFTLESQPFCPYSPWSRSKTEYFVRSRTCSDDMAQIESFAAAANITILYTPYVNFNGFGYILMVSKLTGDYDLQEPVLIVREISARIIYCDPTQRSGTISFTAWISPFPWSVWLLLALTVLAISLLISFQQGFSIKILFRSFFNVFAFLMKQCCSKSYMLFLNVVFITVFLTCTMYFESYMTANLISPSKIIPYANLSQVVHAGYKIINYDPGNLYLQYMEYDFKRHGLSDMLNKTILIVDQIVDVDNIASLYNTTNPKMAIYDNEVNSGTVDRTYKFQIAFPKQKCFRIEEELQPGMVASFLFVHISQRIKYVINTFSESGIRMFWKMQEKFKNEVVRRNMRIYFDTWPTHDHEFIRFRNLFPVFGIYGILITFSLTAFISEFVNIFKPHIYRLIRSSLYNIYLSVLLFLIRICQLIVIQVAKLNRKRVLPNKGLIIIVKPKNDGRNIN